MSAAHTPGPWHARVQKYAGRTSWYVTRNRGDGSWECLRDAKGVPVTFRNRSDAQAQARAALAAAGVTP